MVSTASLWLHADDPAPTATIARVTDDRLTLTLRPPHSQEHALFLTGTYAQIAAIVDQLDEAIAGLLVAP